MRSILVDVWAATAQEGAVVQAMERLSPGAGIYSAPLGAPRTAEDKRCGSPLPPCVWYLREGMMLEHKPGGQISWGFIPTQERWPCAHST